MCVYSSNSSSAVLRETLETRMLLSLLKPKHCVRLSGSCTASFCLKVNMFNAYINHIQMQLTWSHAAFFKSATFFSLTALLSYHVTSNRHVSSVSWACKLTSNTIFVLQELFKDLKALNWNSHLHHKPKRNFFLSDRGAVCTARGPCALYGFPAFALAGALSVAQSAEQQSRGGWF